MKERRPEMFVGSALWQNPEIQAADYSQQCETVTTGLVQL